MKQIKLPFHGVIKPTPGQPVNMGVALRNSQQARENGQILMSFALATEREIDDLLAGYFIRDSKPRMTIFIEYMLGSDAFTFMAKRRILMRIVDYENFLNGESRNALDSQLAFVMQHRNAFAHGDIVERSDGTYLSYFSGGPREDRLDDEYWSKVEERFSAAGELMRRVRELVGYPLPTPGILDLTQKDAG